MEDSGARERDLTVAFLLGLGMAIVLAWAGSVASEPTAEELHQFRHRLCSGYDPGE